MDIWTLDFWLEFFSKGGIVIVFVGAMVGFGIKLKNFVKTVRKGKDQIWKERQVKKILDRIGTGRLMDILLTLDEIFDIVSSEDIIDLLVSFKNHFDLQKEMEDTVEDLKHFLTFEKKVVSPTIHDMLSEYRIRKQVSSMKNAKRWNRMRKNPKIKKAVSSLLKHYNLLKIKAGDDVKRRSRVGSIKEKIEAMTSEENVLNNRERRKFIEAVNEKRRFEEKEKELKEIQERLHDIFKE